MWLSIYASSGVQTCDQKRALLLVTYCSSYSTLTCPNQNYDQLQMNALLLLGVVGQGIGPS